ncbi:autotransporter domain-containing protein [uncultured Anaerovibrio sp.]|uniref:autotransporter outer membrane beta-barrel domain-containing protein n=1 Tax=uncultured Anaerovibrio sp. TaxID=361586 RepID=UPI0026393FB0|nr:autotransporter outer membrane beta-barrel domain-containing protein [uncultured Anaerovibrio sp.]
MKKSVKLSHKLKLSHKALCALTASIVLGMSAMSAASAGEIIYAGDKKVFDVTFMEDAADNQDKIRRFIFPLGMEDRTAMDLSEDNKAGILKGIQYWADILGPGANITHPAQIFVAGMEKEQNAYSGALAIDKGRFTIYPYWEQYLQGLRNLQDINIENIVAGPDYRFYENGQLVNDAAYGSITFGQYMGGKRKGTTDGWWMKSNTVLPDNEHATDGVAMSRHELAHSLGILAQERIVYDDDGKPVVDKDGNTIYVFPEKLPKDNIFLTHLYDQNLNRAQFDQLIITSQEFKRRQAADPDLVPSDFFIVDNMLNEKLDPSKPRQGRAYFIGDNVSEVLNGRTYDGVTGLPMNTWERDIREEVVFDLAHIEIGGLMSHDPYRNITVFNEAELAVLQDIGYTIDRRAFFGHSVYNTGITFTNTHGYSARSSDGTAYINEYSTVPLGIGLHVHGAKNDITQAANIYTQGEGAVGILVDATENKLTLAKGYEVHADGREGVGVQLSYGRNQVFNQQGTVTANGEKGSGVRFDFGSNMLGACEIYRGSYISYLRAIDVDNGDIDTAKNVNFKDKTLINCKPELEGPLVSEYNLSGALSGSGNAIYIGKNAFVQTINVNPGATITGNITSNWKQFGDKQYEEAYDYDKEWPNNDILRIQYNDMMGEDGYEYNRYIPDLVTNLNVNTDFNYNGDITGTDNMKLNVTAGTMNYGGTADLVNVNVAQGATLLGGSFTVNDMTERMAEGLSDATTGKFYNHGTIGSGHADKDMTITGNLISDGTLYGYAGGEQGQIAVSGKAEVEGSTVTVHNALPGESFTVLKANAINGTIANTADKPHEESGMLSTSGIVNANDITVQAKAANNMGPLSEEQTRAFTAMNNMAQSLSDAGDSRLNDMRPLYAMDRGEAKAALTGLGSSPVANTMVMTQRNTMTSHILSARLTEAFAKQAVNVPIPVAQLDGQSPDKTATITMNLDQPVDNDFWFKVARNWGDGTGSSYYQGTTIGGGWDRAYGRSWRAGVFVSYGTFSFADNLSHDDVKDTRLGLYGGYSNGPHSGYVYLDYGWLKNDLTRQAGLGYQAKADYKSRILELGGEYKYDLNARNMKVWHVSPYANIQLSRLSQDGYTEHGAGIWGQQVDSQSNTYFAGGLGLEFKRYLSSGSYTMRLGVKHAFTGSDPKFTYGYAGDDHNRYEMRGQNDKTHFVMSLGGEAEFAPGWTLAGDVALQKGSHDKDLMAALTLRRMW